MIQFGSINTLWLLLLVPVLVLFFRWHWKRRNLLLARFGKVELVQKLMDSYSPNRSWWKMVLLIGAITFISLALARPQYGEKEEIIRRQGVDIVVAVDTSDSMLSEDIRPNRLMVAKREINALIEKLRGDRIAIEPFAGDAFVLCPLTLDYAAAALLLSEVDTNTVEIPGTAIGRAIEVASRCFVQEERKFKVLILISDGEETIGEVDPLRAARAAAAEGVRIYTIGIGTREGVPIPIRDSSGQLTGYKQTRQGDKALSRLDEDLLRQIAQETGGLYFRATNERFELDRIYDDISQLEVKELHSTVRAQGIDRFQYVLFPALLLLLVELMITERRPLRRVIQKGEE